MLGIEDGKMKNFKWITLMVCTLAWVGATTVNADTCCETAKKAGKACEHKCCIEAAKNKKSCEKCNPKADKKADDKKADAKK